MQPTRKAENMTVEERQAALSRIVQPEANSNHFVVSDKNETTIQLHIYSKQVLDENATIDKGEPVYRQELWVKQTDVLDNTFEIDEPVSAKWRERYPLQFAKHDHNEQFGTPLAAIGLEESAIRELQSKNVLTAESLAALHGSQRLQTNPHWRTYVDTARAFVQKDQQSTELVDIAKTLVAKPEKLQELVALLGTMTGDKADDEPPPPPHATGGAGNDPDPDGSQRAQQRLDTIAAACAKLDTENAELWVRSGADKGKPKTTILAEMTGLEVSSADRDAAWALCAKPPSTQS